MIARRAMTIFALVVLPSLPALAAPRFAEPVTVSRGGDGLIVIRFAVAEPADCDCTVAVVDAAGRVVRHLAAGLLAGRKAPPPFQPGSARQQLTWDGLDDAGGPIPAGCRVQVGLGLTASYDKTLGWSADAWAIPRQIVGLGCGPDGTLYVYGADGAAGPMRMVALSRQGKYLRTVMPYPASLPADRRAGLRAATGPHGRVVPVFEERRGGLYPQTLLPPRQTMAVTADGRIGFVGGPRQATPATWPSDDDRGRPVRVPITAVDLLVVGADGGTPTGSFVGPTLDSTAGPICRGPRIVTIKPEPDARRLMSPAALVAAPDGQTLFAAFAGRVLRLGWAKSPGRAVALTRVDQLTVRTLACGGDGNLCVSDARPGPAWRDGRIAILAPADGTVLRSIVTTAPDLLAVHPRTGDFYAFTVADKRLTKLSPAGLPLATLHLPQAVLAGHGGTNLVLDASADPPIVWIAHADRQARLMRVLDRGDRFEAEIIGPEPADAWPGEPIEDLAVDPVDGAIYARRGPATAVRFDPASGKAEPIRWPVQPADRLHVRDRVSAVDIGPDGRFYLLWGDNPNLVVRYDRQFRAVPFNSAEPFDSAAAALAVFGADLSRLDPASAAGPIVVPHRPMNLDSPAVFGFDVAPSGDIYVLRTTVQSARPPRATTAADLSPFETDDRPPADRIDRTMAVDRFAPDGRLKAAAIVAGLPPGCGGVRVDRQGNIYVGASWSAEPTARADLLRQMIAGGPLDYTRFFPSNMRRQDFTIHATDAGAVLKFGPAGGAVAHLGHESVTGLLWQRAVLSPRPAAVGDDNLFGCACQGARFDVDAFGRLFAPDALGCSVGVLDPAGNELIRLGRYGNPDDMPAAGRSGDVPLWFPTCVAATDDALYIGDYPTGRTIRVRLSFQTQQTAPVPGR